MKIAGNQKLLLLVADMHWMIFWHVIHYALFGMDIHLLHILLSNTSYQKVNVPCSEKGWMTANIFFSGQGSSGYQPSSMEYSRFPSALGGQTLEGPSK